MTTATHTEVKPKTRRGQADDAALPKMYDALMYLMHHPSECSATAWEIAREALEAAGMEYEKEVAAVRADRIQSSTERWRQANDPYLIERQRQRILPTEPPPGT